MIIDCEISDGLRPSQCLAAFRDTFGNLHQILVERDFLIDGKGLTVGVIKPGNPALVEFPEATNGKRRAWIHSPP